MVKLLKAVVVVLALVATVSWADDTPITPTPATDAPQDAPNMVNQGDQNVQGMYDLGGQILVDRAVRVTGAFQASTGTINSFMVVGSSYAVSAPKGRVGEVISSVVTNVSAPTSGQYGDLTSIALTSGTWLVSASCAYLRNGATWQSAELGIGTVTGNDPTGLFDGTAYVYFQFASTSVNVLTVPLAIPSLPISISSNATYYAKLRSTYSVAVPVIYGRLTAIRIN